jgi:uridine kinase
MYQAVILLCGVPASGKTWVMKRLKDKFTLVTNDDYIAHGKNYLADVVEHAARSDKPVVVDCPFGEREFKSVLESRGLEVYPFFIVETPDVVAQRYQVREGKPASKSTLTRAASIADRALEWNAPRGTSEEILAHLRELVVTPRGA